MSSYELDYGAGHCTEAYMSRYESYRSVIRLIIPFSIGYISQVILAQLSPQFCYYLTPVFAYLANTTYTLPSYIFVPLHQGLQPKNLKFHCEYKLDLSSHPI